MRSIKFREPMNCQNGHFRWLYKKRVGNRIDNFVPTWGPKHPECNCPTGNLDQGYTPIGADQEFTGLQDIHGKDVWEWDIVRLGASAVACYIVEFKKACFGIQFEHEGFRPLGFYSYVEVLGNLYENIEILENEPSIQAITKALLQQRA